MRLAIRLVKQGMNGSAAALKAGVRRESLYRHAEYKAIREEQKLAALKLTEGYDEC